MIVQLSLVLVVAAHLSHLLERIEHRLYNLVICSIDSLPYLKGVRPNELRLNPADVGGEELDERGDTLPLLAGQFCLLDGFDLVVLRSLEFSVR